MLTVSRACLSLMVFAACSGDDSDDTNASFSTTATATATATATVGTTTVGTTTGTTTTEGTTEGTTEETGESSTTGEPEPVCGNGVVEGDEACDDGNDLNTDECTDTCQVAACGDGYVQEGVEQLNIRSYAPLRAILGHFSTIDPDSIQIRSKFWRSLPLVHPPPHGSDHSAGRPSDLWVTKAGGPSIAA